MSRVTYMIVPHDGGWAYKVGEVFSEPFRTHDEARAAAHRAAGEQKVPGQTTDISWADGDGHWHTETARGEDRPTTDVEG